MHDSDSLCLGADLGSCGARFAISGDAGIVPLWTPFATTFTLPRSRGRPAPWEWKASFANDTSAGAESAARIVLEFLREGAGAASDAAGEPVRRLACAIPSSFSARQTQALAACAAEAGFTDCRFVADSVSAVLGRPEPGRGGATLVFSCGYRCSEWSLVSSTRTEAVVKASRTTGAFSGRALDQLLLERILAQGFPLQQAASLATAMAPSWTATAYRLHRTVQTSELLNIELQSPSDPTSVTVTFERSAWNHALLRLAEEACAEGRKFLESLGTRPERLDGLVLVGGPASIPALRKALEERLRVPVQWLTDWSLAFGAVRSASLAGPRALAAGRPWRESAISAPARSLAGCSAGHIVLELPRELAAARPESSERGNLEEAPSHIAVPRVAPAPGARRESPQVPARDVTRSAESADERDAWSSVAAALANCALDRARGLLTEGRLQEAVQESHRAFDDAKKGQLIGPQCTAILDGMLDVHIRCARAKSTPEGYAESLKWLSCAQGHVPDSILVRRAMADRHAVHSRQLLAAGRWAEALAAAEEACRLHPESPETAAALHDAQVAGGGPPTGGS